MKTLFLPLGETLYVGRLKICAEASEIFTHAVFQHDVDRQTVSSEFMLQGVKNGSLKVLNRYFRVDEGVHPPSCCNCLPCVQTGA
jgi:hypothetical protein